jgi:pimeloyl-ACP methyl ester carboxylesterase
VTRASLVNLGDGFAARIAPAAGETVLWLHGYTLDSSSWQRIWQRLPCWQHIGVDLPGHGASLPLRDGEDLPGLARRIGRLALQYDVRHLVALSFGTLVALQMAIEFPTAFATLVLAAPALGGGPQEEEVGRRYAELSQAYRTHGFGPHLRARWMQSPPNLFKGAEDRPELWEQLWLLVGRHAWWELADDAFGKLGNHPQTRSQLKQIAARTLVLVGEQELRAFKRCAELVHRSIPVCRRIYIPAVGHLCMLEDPETTHALIENHLRGSSIPAPEHPRAGGCDASEP